ncbi:MAG: beta-galactosidase [Dysgonamonadaceae bacterium]|jgi:lysophospholipase L1-like esterase|nr:beta-galactosidase [Dysgonamonadaceae bacterium]
MKNIKKKLLYGVLFCCSSNLLAAQDIIRTGTSVNPAGTTIGVNSQSLLINGKPVIPVMGEIHYARLPENEWRRELLKMKAGGVTIAASYIFWIHHEETEGKYNWNGQRNLRRFLEICKEIDLPVVLRIGPWCHGECRNGGFPEWLVNSGVELRSNNDKYLSKVRTWFGELYRQVEGLLWKDGGPVAGIQIENEYAGTWEHLMTLKHIAQELGFDTPLYTRTGWPQLSTPATFGEMIPLYGGYAEGFWNRELADMPGSDYKSYFIFRSFRNAVGVATEQLPSQSATDNPDDTGYPNFACELGGGMVPGYHRRVNINPMDIYTMSLVQIGSGGNLPGYYMYHGGTNPDSELTYLNEKQNSKYTNYNDLPAKGYDFQAPLGEFGQVNEHYHLLRRLHLFLQDFGSDLALMPPFFPDGINRPDDAANTSSLRWSVRSNGESGYVFVNNYQRLQNMPAKKEVSFTVELSGKKLTFPSKPITAPANTCFFMPFNLNLNGVKLKYATAQPIAKIQQDNELTVFFFQIAEIPAGFAFDAENAEMKQANVKYKKTGKELYLENVKAGADIAISLQTKDKALVNIVLLDEKTSLNLYKGNLAGQERIILSASELIIDNDRVELSDTSQTIALSIFPSLKTLKSFRTLKPLIKHNGIFTRYELRLPETPLPKARLTQVRDAGQLRKIEMGACGVASSPEDEDFNHAAVWKISLSRPLEKDRDVYLRIPYTGDVARIYAGTKLLTDNFYNGKPFEIGLKRFYSDLQDNELTIKILPLAKNAPVHINKANRPVFNHQDYALSLPEVEVYEKRSVTLTTKTPLYVVYIGNSITQGAFIKDPAHDAPPAQASLYLSKQKEIDLRGFSNRGRSGHTTVDFLPDVQTTFPWVAATAEKLAVDSSALLVFSVMLGTNDSAIRGANGAPVSPAQYFTNLQTIMEALFRLYPNAIFVLHRPIWYSPNTDNGYYVYLEAGLNRLEKYAAELERLTETYATLRPNHVFLGDTAAFDYFKKHHETLFVHEEGNTGTYFLHPNEPGAARLGEFWGEAIRRVVENLNH